MTLRRRREADLSAAYWFYEQQSAGLGARFRTSLIGDIESLRRYAGIHEVDRGYHRMLATRPYVSDTAYCIYYRVHEGTTVVVAVLDARQKPSWIRKRLG